MRYDASNLIVHPGRSADPEVVVEVTPEQAGWKYIHFQVRQLRARQAWSFATGEHELALVILSGRVDVDTDRGRWLGLGGRSSVFAGLPHALYLPRSTTLAVTGVINSEFAGAWVSTDQ